MRRPKNPDATSAADRRKELTRVIREVGVWNINHKQYAEKFKISRMQIGRDIKKIMRHLEREDLSVLGKIFEMSYQKAMKESLKLMNHTDPQVRLHAIKVGNDTTGKYTEFLEKWGFKEKVAETVNVELTHEDFNKAYEETIAENVIDVLPKEIEDKSDE